MPATASGGERRVLFVTRKYPPAVGGMELHAARTRMTLESMDEDVDVVALGRSQAHLVWWLPFAAVWTAWMVRKRVVTHLVVGDALAYLALRPLLWRTRVKRIVFVHGLDLTFDAPLYRRMVASAMRRNVTVIANSRSTAKLARDLGVPDSRLHTIHPPYAPVDVTPAERTRAAAELRRRFELAESDRVLVTVTRLVKRKGVAWFVGAVLQRLAGDVHYLVAGGGPEEQAVQAAARAAGVSDRVRLLGRVDDDTRRLLLSGADVFLQPNVAVAGDVEGFGMAMIEAGLHGLPVVAARLEGIEDAVLDGTTGILCRPGDATAFTAAIDRLLSESDDAMGANAPANIRERFGPDVFRGRLSSVLERAE